MEWRYIGVRKERAEIPAHASNLAACDSNCRASWLQGPGLEVLLCLGSVLLPHVDSNRYCRQGPKRQFASRKFKFKLAARPRRPGPGAAAGGVSLLISSAGARALVWPSSLSPSQAGAGAAAARPRRWCQWHQALGRRGGRCQNRDRCWPNSGWLT